MVQQPVYDVSVNIIENTPDVANFIPNFQLTANVGGQVDNDITQALLYSSPFLVSNLIIPLDYDVQSNLVQIGCVTSENILSVAPSTTFSTAAGNQMLSSVNTKCDNPIVSSIVSIEQLV